MFFQSKQNNNYWYVLQEKAKFLQIFWMARGQVNKKQKNNHIWLHIYFNLLMYSLLFTQYIYFDSCCKYENEMGIEKKWSTPIWLKSFWASCCVSMYWRCLMESDRNQHQHLNTHYLVMMAVNSQNPKTQSQNLNQLNVSEITALIWQAIPTTMLRNKQ